MFYWYNSWYFPFFSSANRTANRFLSLYVLMISFVFFYQGITISIGIQNIPWLARLDDPLPFLIGPLFYFYTRSLTSNSSIKFKKDWIHLIPFVAFSLYILPWLLTPFDERVGAEELAGERAFFSTLKLASCVGYLVASFMRIQHYREKLRDSFSNIEKINLN